MHTFNVSVTTTAMADTRHC